VKFERATLELGAAFRTLGKRRRIGKLHLHGADCGECSIATIERVGDQSKRIGFARHIDRQPVDGGQFGIEHAQRTRAPPHGTVGCLFALEQRNAADKDTILVESDAAAVPA
jgi:hypothetical protein